jgi:transcriptional regulator with XRE-family HTH domain
VASLLLHEKVNIISFETMNPDKNEVVKKVGENIRKHRECQNLTIEKLALKANMEYSQISRIERGVINTSLFHVYRISKCLEIPLAEFFNDL